MIIKFPMYVPQQGTLPCEIVVLSAGIRPNTGFLAETGLEMFKGTILTDGGASHKPAGHLCGGRLRDGEKTGLPVRRSGPPWAHPPIWRDEPLAQTLAGKEKCYPGVLGTGVVKLPGLNCGRTGLTEAAAREAGFDVETVVAVTDDKAHYYPGSDYFITKLIADKKPAGCWVRRCWVPELWIR